MFSTVVVTFPVLKSFTARVWSHKCEGRERLAIPWLGHPIVAPPCLTALAFGRAEALEAALNVGGSGAFLQDVLGSEGGSLPTRCGCDVVFVYPISRFCQQVGCVLATSEMFVKCGVHIGCLLSQRDT